MKKHFLNHSAKKHENNIFQQIVYISSFDRGAYIWNKKFDLLSEFIIENGGELPRQRSKFRNINIGWWCSTQRAKQKNGTLSEERIAKLESIDGWWWGKKNENIWFRTLNILSDYVANKGELPKFSSKFRGINIGIWCDKQRQKKKNGTLSKDKIDKLESIEGWWWKKMKKSITWLEMFNILSDYVTDKGELPKWFSKIKDKERNINIGRWCNKQRQNKRIGNLSEDRINKLESIEGWWWKKREIRPWLETRNLLFKYVRNKGKLPQQFSEFKGVNIGAWCNTQRQNKRIGKLSEDRIDKLESIEGWWWNKYLI